MGGGFFVLFAIEHNSQGKHMSLTHQQVTAEEQPPHTFLCPDPLLANKTIVLPALFSIPFF